MIKTRLFLDINKITGDNSVLYSRRDIQRGNRGELGNILELRIGYGCNNNCRYCPVAQKRHLGDRTTEECKKILRENRKERNLLVISGGEPTIRGDLFDLIAYARDLDYQWIQLKTNGRMFSQKDFAQKVIDLIKKHPVSDEQRQMGHFQGYNFGGLDIFEFYISLLALNSELHDFITGVPGSFNETIRGIKNLLDLNQAVAINIIITKLNYRYLPEIVKYLDNLRLKYIELSFIEPEGNALVNFNWIVPRLNEIESYFPRLSMNFTRDRKSCKKLIKSVPLCCLQENKVLSAEWFYPYDRHTMYKLIDFDNSTTYYEEQTRKNIKKKECRYCIYEPICYGFNKNYVERFGLDELRPISGQLAGELVEKSKIKQLDNLEKIKLSDLRLEFNDPELKVDFGNTKADAISMLSGGVDSSLAAAIYAKKNKDKKIVLITFSECYSPGAEGSKINAGRLMEKYKNIIKHFIIPVPYILSKKLIFEDLEEEYKKLNYYPTCIKCKYSRLSYGIYLLKRYFGGDTIISGHRKGEGTSRKKYEESFLNKYSIKIALPIFSLVKEDTIKLAREEGLIFVPPNQHSTCQLSSLKSRLKKREFDADLLCEKESKKFQDLLKFNGVFPKKDNCCL